jgi:hypothetical protein
VVLNSSQAEACGYQNTLDFSQAKGLAPTKNFAKNDTKSKISWTHTPSLLVKNLIYNNETPLSPLAGAGRIS